MDYSLAAGAGVLQGLTEFLPVSSTGHLIIFEKIFGISQQKFGLAFDASLHLGTFGAILIFFWKDYLKIINLKNGLLAKLAAGTIPAAIAGLIFENHIETTLRQIWIVAAALILASGVLVAAEIIGKKSKSGQNLTISQALLIGFWQAVALIPGVSRSGATIAGGLFLGLQRAEAAKFAFILSGPIVAAAGAKKFIEAATSRGLDSADFNFFLVGIISSAIFGYLTIKYFLKYLSTKNLYPFVIYRLIIGFALLIPYFLSWYISLRL